MRVLSALLSCLFLFGLGCSGDATTDAPAKASEPAPAAADAPPAAPAPAAAPADGEAWTCSMHPEVRKAEAGRCPKCNMELVKEAGGHDHAAHEGAEGDSQAMDYFCPMHPEERSVEKGRCSKCNMFLVQKGDEASHHGGDAKKPM